MNGKKLLFGSAATKCIMQLGVGSKKLLEGESRALAENR